MEGIIQRLMARGCALTASWKAFSATQLKGLEMADWYDSNSVSPESVSDEEYRDWLVDNVSPEDADNFWYGDDGSSE